METSNLPTDDCRVVTRYCEKVEKAWENHAKVQKLKTQISKLTNGQGAIKGADKQIVLNEGKFCWW